MLSAQAQNLRPAPPLRLLNGADTRLLEEKVYIVQLAAPPALSYLGRHGGMAATRPAKGEQFNARSANVRQYSQHLTSSHDDVLRTVGAYTGKLYSYRYAFNGFAARLSSIQAQKLRSRKDVLNIWEDKIRMLSSNSSSAFLGLLDQDGGLRSDLGLTGEDVIIGIIDSGIAPDHPSFADSTLPDKPKLCQSSWAENSLLGKWLCFRFNNADPELNYQPVENWNGRCETGDSFTASDCNNKIIGARYYVDGFLESSVLDSNEFISPRDADGHGSHIASIAAGNDVRASLSGTFVARVSGVAPRARLAVYKACWLESGQTRGSCSTADLQRAIEDAVADGVDIINYSIGSSDTAINDPDDLALLAASDAGVLSIVAGGNDGPSADTILSPAGAPWVLTVAASSRSGERFEEAMRVDTPGSVAGLYATKEANFTPPLKDVGPISSSLVLVDDDVGTDAAGPLGTSFDACEPPINDAELLDKIALLQRGSCDFQVKIDNVETAGAIAALVFQNQGEPIIMAGTRNSVNIPAVMIGQADGQLLFDRLRNGESVEVTLDKTLFLNIPDSGDVMGSFSARGSNLGAPDILKPDVTAPGVNILAAQTPEVANGIRGEEFQYLSGTSQAAPQVAGIAALIKEAQPDWSPAAIRSALVTTARQNIFKEDTTTNADPFDFGGGHVVANKAINPGLVYDAGKPDYDAFTCGTEHPRVNQTECDTLVAAGFSVDASSLNLPSIAVSNLVSSHQVTRRVTNTGDNTQFSVNIDAPEGIQISVVPEVLSVGSGESASYQVNFTAVDAELYKWQFGAISWESNDHVVRSPLAVRSLPFLAAEEVRSAGSTGSLELPVQFGYTGPYETTVHGLAPADSTQGFVFDDPTDSYFFEPDGDQLPIGTGRFIFTVLENQAHLRVALFDAETDGNDDLDLYVYYCPGLVLCSSVVGISGSDTSEEEVNLSFPAAGDYVVDVHGFATDNTTGGIGANFTLFVWAFGQTDDRGNMTVTAPTSAVSGQSDTVQVNWQGLSADKHLGAVTHSDGTSTVATTIIAVDN